MTFGILSHDRHAGTGVTAPWQPDLGQDDE